MTTPHRLLHLEDNALDADLVRERLTLDGLPAVIKVVYSQPDFMSALQTDAFDVILADYNLPAFDGLTALSAVRANFPTLPFIFVTGELGEERAIETLQQGATDYVLKDRLSRLKPAVQRALDEANERRARQLAEVAAEAEREWLRITLASIGDAVIASDPNGRLTFINRVAEQTTGWREAEAIGQPVSRVFNIVNEVTRAPVESPVEKVLRDGVIAGLANHTVLIRKDGSELPIDDSGAPIRDAQGRLIGVVLVFRDISERHRAEAEIRSARQLLEKTFASMDQAVLVVDPRTRTIISANPSIERIFGYTINEAIGRNTQFLHVDQQHYEDFGQRQFEALDQRGMFHGELQMRRRDGSVFPVEITVTEFHDEAKRRTGVVTVVRDITERIQAASALQAARQAAEVSAARSGRLQRVSAALTPALSPADVTRIVVHAGAEALEASAAAIYLAGDAGQPLTLTESVGYPEAVRRAIQFLPLEAASPGADVFRSGEAMWFRSNVELVAGYPAFGDTRAMTRNEAVAVIPLIIHDRALGVLALSFAQPRNFQQEMRDFLLTLAGQCALALERARLFEAEQLARQQAERAADRTARLQKITAALASAVTPKIMAEAVIREGCSATNASAGILVELLKSGEALQIVAAAGYPAAAIRTDPAPLAAATPLSDCIRSGEPIWISSHAEFAMLYSSLAAVRQGYGNEATVAIPLMAGDRKLGALAFSFAEVRSFPPEERAFLLAIGQHCAQTLERARLYEAEQSARRAAEDAARRTARLQAVTAALSKAVTLDEVADVVVEMAIEAAGASAGVLFAPTGQDGSQLSVLRAKDFPPDFLANFEQFSITAPLPAAEVARTGQAIWLRSQAELAARYPALADVRLHYRLEATAILPLGFEGGVLAVLAIAFAAEKSFLPEDQSLLSTMADAAAQAFERARLFGQIQSLNAELEGRVVERTQALQASLEKLHTTNEELERQVIERQRAELEIRQSERRLAEAQHLARVGSWHWDVDTGAITWSKEMYSIYGVTPDTFQPTFERLLQWAHPEDGPKAQTLFDRAYRDQRPFEFEGRILLGDGSVRTLQVRGDVEIDRDRVRAVQGTAQDITDRKAIESTLVDSQEQLRKLSARLELAREEERRNMAREIHDQLGGDLTGLKIQLNGLRPSIQAHGDVVAVAHLEDLMRSVDQTVMAVRRIATELRPALLDDFGLVAAMEWQINEFSRISGLSCRWLAQPEDIPLAPERAAALFRTFQEALTNVVRHAQASAIDVRVSMQGDAIVLEVQDNGRGISPEEALGFHSLGLLGMRERIRALRGELAIEGTPGKGTTVTIKAPIR